MRSYSPCRPSTPALPLSAHALPASFRGWVLSDPREVLAMCSLTSGSFLWTESGWIPGTFSASTWAWLESSKPGGDPWGWHEWSLRVPDASAMTCSCVATDVVEIVCVFWSPACFFGWYIDFVRVKRSSSMFRILQVKENGDLCPHGPMWIDQSERRIWVRDLDERSVAPHIRCEHLRNEKWKSLSVCWYDKSPINTRRNWEYIYGFLGGSWEQVCMNSPECLWRTKPSAFYQCGCNFKVDHDGNNVEELRWNNWSEQDTGNIIESCAIRDCDKLVDNVLLLPWNGEQFL